MKVLTRSYLVLKRTGAIRVFISFIVFMCIAAIALKLAEPQINTVREGFWYCFVAATTIGFGDFCAVTSVGRAITILVGIYGILTTAMLTGVVVSYYTEYLRSKQDETVSAFLEKLERLPELSKSELAALSEQIRKFNRK